MALLMQRSAKAPVDPPQTPPPPKPPPADVDGDLIEFSVFVRFALCDPTASPAAVRCF